MKKIIKISLIDYFIGFIYFYLYFIFYKNNTFVEGIYYSEIKNIFKIFLLFYLFISPIYFLYKNRSSKYKFDIRFFLLILIKILKKAFKDRSENTFLSIKNSINFKESLILRKILLKTFFFPMMLVFGFSKFIEINFQFPSLVELDFSFNYMMYYTKFAFDLLLFFDCSIFAFAYLVESNLLKNKIKSIDPYLSGWVLALSCYVPFSQITFTLFSINRLYISNIFFTNNNLFIFLKIIQIVFLSIYVWASFALLFKASNLTNRGIVCTGPYRFVRHPAYISKNFVWFIDLFLYKYYLFSIIGFIGVMVIYYLRAITEERHLSMDKDYVRYCKKVKWKFLPKVL